MQLQGCAMPSRMAPCLLGWTCRFCTVRGRSRHDLAMTWGWYASVLRVFCKVFEDFRPTPEVRMHVSYADFFMFLCAFLAFCTKLPDVPCLLVPGKYRPMLSLMGLSVFCYDRGGSLHPRCRELVEPCDWRIFLCAEPCMVHNAP
jgi:hypothetical protein